MKWIMLITTALKLMLCLTSAAYAQEPTIRISTHIYASYFNVGRSHAGVADCIT